MVDLIPNKTPKVLKHFFSTYVWDFYDKKEKTLYLTFDDGPIPDITEFVLEQLQKFEAKATFFCIGENIKKHPHIFNKILSDNHAVGNHTMNHLKAWKSDPEVYFRNVKDCQEMIQKYSEIKHTTQLFRPPYGQISYSKFKTLEKQGYKIILWDILSKDWDKTVHEEQCFQNVTQNTSSGSIIVFHDSIKAEKNLRSVLPRVLDYFTKRGFVFDKIED